MRWNFVAVILGIAAAVLNTAPALAQSEPLQPEGIGYEHLDDGTVWLELDDDVGEDEAALRAMVDRLPSWEIGGRPDYQIVRDPEFFENYLLVAVKRDDWKTPRAYKELLHRSGPMDIVAITEYYSHELHQKSAWASNVPEPIYLGPISDPEFEERLRSFMAPIARQKRLLAMEYRTSGRTTAICLSTEIPIGPNCPMRGPEGLLDVPRGADVAMKIRMSDRDGRYLHVLTIAPDRSVSFVLSVPPDNYSTDAGQGTSQPYYYTYIDTGDIPIRFDQPGVYRVLTIASEHSLDPYIFEPVSPSDTSTYSAPAYIAPGQVARRCANPLEKKLCDILAGTMNISSMYISGTDVAVTDVYSTEPDIMVPAIVNGRFVGRADALWQVQLFKQRDGPALGRSGDRGRTAWRLNFEKAHKCGASYLGDGFVLTAAHCVNKPGQVLYIRMGTLDIANGGRSFRIASVVTHKWYGTGRDYDDIAVLRIDSSQLGWARDLERKGLLAPISLDTQNIGQGHLLLATGWGQMSRAEQNNLIGMDNQTQRNPRYLLGADLKSVSDRQCQNLPGFSSFSMAKIVCAGAPGEYVDACYGDSGGPLTRKSGGARVLVGIVSGGDGCAKTLGAAGLYTRVSEYRNWVERAKRVARNPGRFVLSD